MTRYVAAIAVARDGHAMASVDPRVPGATMRGACQLAEAVSTGGRERAAAGIRAVKASAALAASQLPVGAATANREADGAAPTGTIAGGP